MDNAEKLAYSAAGFGLAVSSTYIRKCREQSAGRRPFKDYSGTDWHKKVLEEDPMHDEDEGARNFLEEAYFDNFDTVKKNYDEAKHATIMTLLADGVETFLIDGEFFGIDQYPEAGAGVFMGIKAGKKMPTPKDVSEMYRGLVSDS